MNITKAIKVAMAQRETNITKLAETLGVDRSVLTRTINGGNPTMASLKGIAGGLGMSVSELVKLGE